MSRPNGSVSGARLSGLTGACSTLVSSLSQIRLCAHGARRPPDCYNPPNIGIAARGVNSGDRHIPLAKNTKMSAWPTEIRLSKDRRTLHVSFEDGANYALAAELLRVESPSAEVQGHGPSQKQTVPGKREVEILKVEPVGHYAVRLTFDDMHDTGIYGWDYLRELGRDGEAKLQAYCDALAERGLSRERVRR